MSKNSKSNKHSKQSKRSKSKKCRRAPKKKNSNTLVLFGINCKDIRKKLDSLGKIILDQHPTILILQETHKTKPGRIKTANSDKYVWFELIRQETRL